MVAAEAHSVPAPPGQGGQDLPDEADPRPIDSDHFRSVLGRFCSGITVVAAIGEQGPVGFTCQSFFSVSLDPPLIAFSVSHGSTSYPKLKHAPAFCVNVLGSDQAGHSQVLSSKDPGKWAKVPWAHGAAGAAVRIHGALAWIDCAPWAEYVAGDHTIVVARVLDLAADLGKDPLLYFNREYRRLHPDGMQA
jgi:flavin reductase (DIM6/NTAB) family NADH-FMN oxidoreductase RutF